jgi:hypothetical protein
MEPAIFPSSPTWKPNAVKAEAWRLRQHAAELEKAIAVARAAIPQGYGNRLRIAALVRAQVVHAARGQNPGLRCRCRGRQRKAPGAGGHSNRVNTR